MSDPSAKLRTGLVPRLGWISVFFRAGTSREDALRIIEENGGADSVPRDLSLGTGYLVAVPVGRELEFATKFSRLIETNDATVEYVRKE